MARYINNIYTSISVKIDSKFHHVVVVFVIVAFDTQESPSEK